VLSLLAEAKANLEAKLAKEGAWTALRMAVGFKHNDCVRVLLQYEVDVDAKSQAYIAAHPECVPKEEEADESVSDPFGSGAVASPAPAEPGVAAQQKQQKQQQQPKAAAVRTRKETEDDPFSSRKHKSGDEDDDDFWGGEDNGGGDDFGGSPDTSGAKGGGGGRGGGGGGGGGDAFGLEEGDSSSDMWGAGVGNEFVGAPAPAKGKAASGAGQETKQMNASSAFVEDDDEDDGQQVEGAGRQKSKRGGGGEDDDDEDDEGGFVIADQPRSVVGWAAAVVIGR
jgi:hypothetical protein